MSLTVAARWEVDATPYNSTVTRLRHIHSELMLLWVRPDFGRLAYLPGQYATLGLGSWEPHLDCDEAIDGLSPRLIRRAYSISHTPLDEAGALVLPGDVNELEFFIALVRHTRPGRPMLTPRLFQLQSGDRLFLDPIVHGTYTLVNLPTTCNVLFAATGTGEAPHNAMIAELLARGHQGKIASIVCVRKREDLAYQQAHQHLARMFPNYRYVPLTTREAENIDSALRGYVGKKYVQDVLRAADTERTLGFPLAPQNTHVFLCGNPEMIGLTAAESLYLNSGAIGLLTELGFTIDSPAHSGNIHFERYF